VFSKVFWFETELAEFQRSRFVCFLFWFRFSYLLFAFLYSTMDFLVRAAVRDVDEASTATLFVVDVSGSMNTSLPVTRAQVPAFVREKRRQEFAQLLNQGEGAKDKEGKKVFLKIVFLWERVCSGAGQQLCVAA
jgi:hypothetical protein